MDTFFYQEARPWGNLGPGFSFPSPDRQRQSPYPVVAGTGAAMVWFVRKPNKRAAIVAVAVGIGLAASSDRSAAAAHLLWEQGAAGSIPAAPTMIFTGP